MSQEVQHLSANEKEVLEAIKTEHDNYDDIEIETGISRPQIRRLCKQLLEKGLITRDDKTRQLKVKES